MYDAAAPSPEAAAPADGSLLKDVMNSVRLATGGGDLDRSRRLRHVGIHKRTVYICDPCSTFSKKWETHNTLQSMCGWQARTRSCCRHGCNHRLQAAGCCPAQTRQPVTHRGSTGSSDA